MSTTIIAAIIDAVSNGQDENDFNWDLMFKHLGFRVREARSEEGDDDDWSPPPTPEGWTPAVHWANAETCVQGVIWIQPTGALAELLMRRVHPRT